VAAHKHKNEGSSAAPSVLRENKGKQTEKLRDISAGDAWPSTRRVSNKSKGKRLARAGSFSAGCAVSSARLPCSTRRSTGSLAKSWPPTREPKNQRQAEQVAEELVGDEPEPSCDFFPTC